MSERSKATERTRKRQLSRQDNSQCNSRCQDTYQDEVVTARHSFLLDRQTDEKKVKNASLYGVNQDFNANRMNNQANVQVIRQRQDQVATGDLSLLSIKKHNKLKSKSDAQGSW